LAFPAQEHLSFPRPKSLERLINQPPKNDRLKEMLAFGKFIFYLQYAELAKKYLS